MTHSGVLATILSGLEPSIAIALACVPLLRPLFGSRGARAKSSQYHYGSGGDSGLYSKNSRRGVVELHDIDDGSEVELEPRKPTEDVKVRSSTWIDSSGAGSQPSEVDISQNITVQKRWEVRSDYLQSNKI
jgi:hypothetical protein